MYPYVQDQSSCIFKLSCIGKCKYTSKNVYLHFRLDRPYINDYYSQTTCLAWKCNLKFFLNNRSISNCVMIFPAQFWRGSWRPEIDNIYQ